MRKNDTVPAKKTLSAHAFLKRVKDTVKRHMMLKKGDRVIAAVSGGADSVCLLDVLCCMKNELSLEIIVANLDHGLRDRESVEDSDFVKFLAKKKGLKCLHKKIDLKKKRSKKLSLEESGRAERYKFFRHCAVEERCGIIATGHTLDDQAETVMMRVITGTSCKGLSGIPPVRRDDGIRIIRPLIRSEREDIVAYVKKRGLTHVTDSSNRDRKFVRNSVRLDVIPFLEKYNPKIKRSLSNLADSIREDCAFIDEAKEKMLRTSVRIGNGREFTISTVDCLSAPEAVRREVVMELFVLSGGNRKKLTYRHWIDIDYFIKTADTGSSIDLPGMVKLVKRRKEIEFERSKQ